MKNNAKKIIFVSLLIIAAILMLTACDLSGVSNMLKTEISKCDISIGGADGVSESGTPIFLYTGEEIRPEVEVKFSARTLQKDTDYSIDYFDNKDLGVANIRLVGKSNFKGEANVEFMILSKLPTAHGEQPEEDDLTYVFSAEGASVISGKLTQYVKSVDLIEVPVVEKLGYEFLYWTYNSQRVDFSDKTSLPQDGGTFVAQFSLNTYSIAYHLNGGENSPLNREEYTVEDTFVLQDAKKEGMQFAGWYLDSNFDVRFNGFEGVAKDLNLHAKFVDYEYKKLSYRLPDGLEEMPFDMYYPGAQIASPRQVLSADKDKKLVWYVDEAMTVRLNNKVMPNEDMTVYARWEDVLYAGFLDRNWDSITDIQIDSYDDMLAFVEFVYFTGNTSDKSVPVTYVSGKTNIENEFNKAYKECTFPKHFNVRYGANDMSIVCYHYNKNGEYDADKNKLATVTLMEKNEYYTQIGDVFSTYQSKRISTFNDFAINKVDRTYECETTDQLFYVLSHGYRPLPVSGSAADRAYRQFKNIMREICDDDMTDLQKVEAIYDWLIINVCYDYAVAYPTTPLAKPSSQYKAFFIEGVLEGAAVCDGLSKAYSVMCAIEGIDCVRVTGKLKGASESDAGHAWNKVQLMGDWYLSDSTWGNKAVSSDSRDYEYVSYEYFLFSDAMREYGDNYESNEYKFYIADGDYDYYKGYKLQLDFTSTILGKPNEYTRVFDLYINGDEAQDMTAVEELSYVLEYIDRYDMPMDGMALDVMIGERVNLAEFIQDVNREYKNNTHSFTSPIISFISNRDSYGYIEKDSVVTLIFSLPA